MQCPASPRPIWVAALVAANFLTIMLVRTICSLEVAALARDTSLPVPLEVPAGNEDLYIYIGALIVSAFVVDRFASRRWLIGLNLLVVFGSVCIAWAANADILRLGSAFQAAGEGGTAVATVVLIARHTRKEAWPLVFASYASAVMLAPVIANAADTILRLYLISRVIILPLTGVSLIIALLAMLVEHDRRSHAKSNADWGRAIGELLKTRSYLLLAMAACSYLFALVPLFVWAPVRFAAIGMNPSRITTLMMIISLTVPLLLLLAGPFYSWARRRDVSLPLYGGALISVTVGLLVYLPTIAVGTTEAALTGALILAPLVNPLFLFTMQDMAPSAGRGIALALVLACQILLSIGLSRIPWHVELGWNGGPSIFAALTYPPFLIAFGSAIAALSYFAAARLWEAREASSTS